MAETIERGCDGSQKWHWCNVMNDLEKQGGLAGVVIDPLSMDAHGCGGQTKEGTTFYITWVPDTFLLVSTSKEEQVLVEAFAKVVEYRPFCRYVNKKGLLTFEWDKKDPEGRFAELRGETELQRVQ